MTKEEIKNATTKEALTIGLLCHWVVARNTWRVIDKFAHRFPWICIGVTIATSLLVSLVCVANAKAECDKLNIEILNIQEKTGITNFNK